MIIPLTTSAFAEIPSFAAAFGESRQKMKVASCQPPVLIFRLFLGPHLVLRFCWAVAQVGELYGVAELLSTSRMLLAVPISANGKLAG
jgi:hypothetical protein